jgi:hypothetical protein
MKLFHVKHLLLAALLGSVMASASAQKMYRCPSPGGGTTFTDTPCASGPGSEMQVKPASGGSAATTASSGAPQDDNKAAKDKKLRAENLAKFSPECRRAADAYDAKAADKSGQAELAVKGNPIAAAWQKCVLDRLMAENPLDAAPPKPTAAEMQAAAAAEQKRREQDAITVKKLECNAKLKQLAESRPRLAQMNEQYRAAFRAVEQSLPADCR